MFASYKILKDVQKKSGFYMGRAFVVKCLMNLASYSFVVIVHLKHLLLVEHSLSRYFETEKCDVINAYIFNPFTTNAPII